MLLKFLPGRTEARFISPPKMEMTNHGRAPTKFTQALLGSTAEEPLTRVWVLLPIKLQWEIITTQG